MYILIYCGTHKHTHTHTHTQFIPPGGLNPKGQLSLVYIHFLKVILVS